MRKIALITGFAALLLTAPAWAQPQLPLTEAKELVSDLSDRAIEIAGNDRKLIKKFMLDFADIGILVYILSREPRDVQMVEWRFADKLTKCLIQIFGRYNHKPPKLLYVKNLVRKGVEIRQAAAPWDKAEKQTCKA